MDSGGPGGGTDTGGGLGGTGGTGAEPDTGGLGGGLGGAIGGINSGLGAGGTMADITSSTGGATSTATAGGGLADITAGAVGGPVEPGGGFLDSIEKTLAGIDLTAALGGLVGSTIGSALGPAGSIALGYAGAKGADALFGAHSFDSLTGGAPAVAGQGTTAGMIDKGFGALASAVGPGAINPQPSGGGNTGPSENSALLPSSNAAIALGVPTGTTTQNVAQTLGVPG